MKRMSKVLMVVFLIVALSFNALALDPILQELLNREPDYDNDLWQNGLDPILLHDLIFHGDPGGMGSFSGTHLEINTNIGNTNGHLRFVTPQTMLDVYYLDDNDPNSIGVSIEIGGIIIHIPKDMPLDELERLIHDILNHLTGGNYEDWWVSAILKGLIATLRAKGII